MQRRTFLGTALAAIATPFWTPRSIAAARAVPPADHIPIIIEARPGGVPVTGWTMMCRGLEITVEPVTFDVVLDRPGNPNHIVARYLMHPRCRLDVDLPQAQPLLLQGGDRLYLRASVPRENVVAYFHTAPPYDIRYEGIRCDL